MKKVRLAFAAAAPVLGLAAAPAAHAATTSANGRTGTTTSGRHAAGATPDVVCYSQNVRSAFNPSGTLRAEIIFGGNSCVAYQQARLDYAQTGYEERVRYWTKNNTLITSHYLAGDISGNATYWSSRPDRYAYQICAAIVPNGNHGKVVWGPVCNFTDG